MNKKYMEISQLTVKWNWVKKKEKKKERKKKKKGKQQQHISQI